jgi:hypothetical protein
MLYVTTVSLCSQGGNGPFSWTKMGGTSHSTTTLPASYCSWGDMEVLTTVEWGDIERHEDDGEWWGQQTTEMEMVNSGDDGQWDGDNDEEQQQHSITAG